MKLGSVLFKTALATGGVVVLYRTFVPSEEQMQEALIEKHGDQTDDLRMLKDLSAQGYSYQAITQIIKKEKFERIQEQLKKDREEKLLRGEPIEEEVPFPRRDDGKLRGFISPGTGKQPGFGEG